MYFNEEHKMIVEKTNKYAYIGTYEKDELMENGKVRPSERKYVKVKHLYCGSFHSTMLFYFKRERFFTCSSCCNYYENSFAYYIECELGLNLYDIWDFQKNELNPYYVTPGSHLKAWFKCSNGNKNHPSYYTEIRSFARKGRRCPYCSHNKISYYDSIGYLYPEKVSNWNYELNQDTPYDLSPLSSQKRWFNCEDCGTPYIALISTVTRRNRSHKCRKCGETYSKGEQKINKWLSDNQINFEIQKEFNGLTGIGNGNLSYDFYLSDYNLLIEYQGEFHDGNTRRQTREDIKRQQEHDRRKQQYAESHNIDLLEIWYYDFNNIDEILFTKLIKEGSNYVENNRLSS